MPSSLDSSIFPDPGSDGQYEKVPVWLTPNKSIEFLGFQVNSQTMSLVFPAQKQRKIQQDAQKLLGQQNVSV